MKHSTLSSSPNSGNTLVGGSAVNLKRENTEIFDQKHQMFAEGSCDDEPTTKEVIDFVMSIGWAGKCINISFDGMQNVWRWTCDISRP